VRFDVNRREVLGRIRELTARLATPGGSPTGRTAHIFAVRYLGMPHRSERRLHALIVQIEDKELRNAAETLKDHSIGMLAAHSAEQGERSRRRAMVAPTRFK
jgi:hypothetical protein